MHMSNKSLCGVFYGHGTTIMIVICVYHMPTCTLSSTAVALIISGRSPYAYGSSSFDASSASCERTRLLVAAVALLRFLVAAVANACNG